MPTPGRFRFPHRREASRQWSDPPWVRAMMLRKQIIRPTEPQLKISSGRIDVAAVATILVTSEDSLHPVDHAFDAHSGSGGTRWVAGESGEQMLILAFDAPQTIRRVLLEVEEREVARTQELQVAVSGNGGRTYWELLRQEYNFSTPGTTFEREDWAVVAEGVTHLRL